MSSQGCDKTFLGKNLHLPRLNKNSLAPLIAGNSSEIKYTHYSAFLHKERLLPLMTAVNIKGETFLAPVRTGSEPWEFSGQVEKKYQLDGSFYRNDMNTLDRGHLVRRIDPCWGDEVVSSQAEGETFRWINCTPQHKKLNQKGGVWYQLEQHVLEHGVKNKIADISVFSGPVLDSNDKVFTKKYKNRDLKIPIVFWKVIAWKKSNGKLYAVGFMMSQYEWVKNKLMHGSVSGTLQKRALPKLDDDYFENLKFSDHKTYQVPISAIEKATGIKFNWRNVSFPFKSATFKAIQAAPLKKVHAVSDLHRSFINIKTGVVHKEKTSGIGVLKPLSKTEVSKRVKNGFQSTIKRYTLKNVTL